MTIKWKTEKRKISELIPTANNPRILTTKQYEDLKKSLTKFDLAEIPAINKDNTILAGHMRLKVLSELKGDIEIDVRVPNRQLNEKEAQEYLIRSNKNTGEWDYEKLANEFDDVDLKKWGFDENDFGFNNIEDNNKLDEKYSQKIGEVLYEPKNTNHLVKELFQRETKFDEEIALIKNEELQEMLKARLCYFHNYNYSKIADYYAYQANIQEKIIFEKLALVLLDKDKLIENGFADLLESFNLENNADCDEND